MNMTNLCVKKEMALHREVLIRVHERDPEKAAQAILTAIGGFPDRVADMLRGNFQVVDRQ